MRVLHEGLLVPVLLYGSENNDFTFVLDLMQYIDHIIEGVMGNV